MFSLPKQANIKLCETIFNTHMKYHCPICPHCLAYEESIDIEHIKSWRMNQCNVDLYNCTTCDTDFKLYKPFNKQTRAHTIPRSEYKVSVN